MAECRHCRGRNTILDDDIDFHQDRGKLRRVIRRALGLSVAAPPGMAPAPAPQDEPQPEPVRARAEYISPFEGLDSDSEPESESQQDEDHLEIQDYKTIYSGRVAHQMHIFYGSQPDCPGCHPTPDTSTATPTTIVSPAATDMPQSVFKGPTPRSHLRKASRLWTLRRSQQPGTTVLANGANSSP